MYANLYLAEEVHQIGGVENRSPVEDSKSLQSDCNSAAMLFHQRRAQPGGWVDKNNPALKETQQLSYRKTTQHLGKIKY